MLTQWCIKNFTVGKLKDTVSWAVLQKKFLHLEASGFIINGMITLCLSVLIQFYVCMLSLDFYMLVLQAWFCSTRIFWSAQFLFWAKRFEKTSSFPRPLLLPRIWGCHIENFWFEGLQNMASDQVSPWRVPHQQPKHLWCSLTKEYKHEDLIVAELRTVWNVSRNDNFSSAVSGLHAELVYEKIPRSLLFWVRSY